MTANLTYDREADAVYIYVGRGKVASNDEVSPSVILDYDEEQRVIGIEVLNASKVLAPGDWVTAPSPSARPSAAAE